MGEWGRTGQSQGILAFLNVENKTEMPSPSSLDCGPQELAARRAGASRGRTVSLARSLSVPWPGVALLTWASAA